MGFLRDLLIKDKTKKFWVGIFIDVFLIAMLLVISFQAKAGYMNGWDDCKEQSCTICWYELQNSSTKNKNTDAQILLNITKK